MNHSLSDFVDLTAEQRAVLEAFERDVDLCQTFYFTGGTLLKALGIGPRTSNDLDFFTFPKIDGRLFFERRKKMHALFLSVFGEQNIHVTEEAYIHRPSGMALDIVIENIGMIDDFVSFGALKTAGIKDIAAGKAAALCSRDEIKDYVDIAFLTKNEGWRLKDLEEIAERKYGLGTITEEKLLAELIAKKEQFAIAAKMFLRDGEQNIAFVQSQIASLIEHTTL